MRIIFMGTPEFAVQSLLACFDIGTVVAVVTQPDKPRGRGQELSFSPVKTLAVERGIPVLQPTKIKGTAFHEELQKFDADVSVVTAYGKILPREVLDAPKQGSVNVHASLLPRFRGAAPIQWAIASGDEKTGVCLMKMTRAWTLALSSIALSCQSARATRLLLCTTPSRSWEVTCSSAHWLAMCTASWLRFRNQPTAW